MEEYDPTKNKWTKKADMPIARHSLSTSVVNGKIYAIGGSIGGGGVALRFASTVEEYDPTTDRWTKKAKMPFTAGFVRTHAMNGEIYAIVAVVERGWEVLEYDPSTDMWRTKSKISSIRWGFSSSVVNGKIYLIGGGLPGPENELVSTVEEYDTGIADLGIEVKRKFATSWGKIKAKY